MREPTPYPDVNAALRDLLAREREALGENFAGMYLSGSLALGDFDHAHSDVDFIVVTAGAITADDYAALAGLHADFAASGSPWAQRIEAVYITKTALAHGAAAGALFPQVEKGTGLFEAELEQGWLYHCFTLRERGVIVAGPDPRTLVAPPDPVALRLAAAPIAATWLDQAQNDPSWIEWVSERQCHSFVVLTLCRMLYTLESGAVASKPAAARWGQQNLKPEWRALIAHAVIGQHEHSPISADELAQTLAMIAYTVEQFRQSQANIYDG